MTDYLAPGVYTEETKASAGPQGGAATTTTRGPLGPEDVVQVARHTTTVSLAVKLTDAPTGGWPVAEVGIAIEDSDAKPVVSRTGYLLFLDIDVELDRPDDPVTVSVDGGDHYQDASRKVVVTKTDPEVPDDVTVLHPRFPVVEFELVPA